MGNGIFLPGENPMSKRFKTKSRPARKTPNAAREGAFSSAGDSGRWNVWSMLQAALLIVVGLWSWLFPALRKVDYLTQESLAIAAQQDLTDTQ